MDHQFTEEQAARIAKAIETQSAAIVMACASFIHLADAFQKIAELATEELRKEASKPGK